MKHYCGGQVIYRPEESAWSCQNCGESFDSIESIQTSNEIAERSDEDLVVEE